MTLLRQPPAQESGTGEYSGSGGGGTSSGGTSSGSSGPSYGPSGGGGIGTPIANPVTATPSLNSLLSGLPNSGAPKAQALPSGMVHWSTKVVILASDTPQPLPGYAVPSGCNVRLRAPSGNADAAFFANYPDKLIAGNGVPLAPQDDVIEQASNLANIWIMGTAGDSIAVSVQTQP